MSLTFENGDQIGVYAVDGTSAVAPQLSATELAENCYYGMFQQCTSLTSAPELPATTLVKNCYYFMFRGCTSLNSVKAAFITRSPSSSTYKWLEDVAATGTFYKNSAAAWYVTGGHGVPSGWTVVTYTP